MSRRCPSGSGLPPRNSQNTGSQSANTSLEERGAERKVDGEDATSKTNEIITNRIRCGEGFDSTCLQRELKKVWQRLLRKCRRFDESRCRAQDATWVSHSSGKRANRLEPRARRPADSADYEGKDYEHQTSPQGEVLSAANYRTVLRAGFFAE